MTVEAKMVFTDCDGVRWVDIVRCGRCGFESRTVEFMRCPRDGRVLVETSVQEGTLEDPAFRLMAETLRAVDEDRAVLIGRAV